MALGLEAFSNSPHETWSSILALFFFSRPKNKGKFFVKTKELLEHISAKCYVFLSRVWRKALHKQIL